MHSIGLISTSLFTGDNPIRAEVEVFDINVVCETAGFMRGTYRYTSVVVNYTANSVPTTSQFEYECDTSSWSPVIFGDAGGTVTTPPEANLDSPLESECGVCLSPSRAAVLFVTIPVVIDANHCGRKLMKIESIDHTWNPFIRLI